MIRTLSAAMVAGALALSMSSAAEARHNSHHRDVVVVKKAPVCRMVTECVVKKKFFKTKRVCTTRRVCGVGHGHGHGHH